LQVFILILLGFRFDILVLAAAAAIRKEMQEKAGHLAREP
jgi:hypothetical protein